MHTFHKPKLNLLSLEIELRVCQRQLNLRSSFPHIQQLIRHLRALVRGYRREDLYGSGLDLQELNQYQGLTHELNVIENSQHHIGDNQSSQDLNHKLTRYRCRHRCLLQQLLLPLVYERHEISHSYSCPKDLLRFQLGE